MNDANFVILLFENTVFKNEIQCKLAIKRIVFYHYEHVLCLPVFPEIVVSLDLIVFYSSAPRR